LFALFLLGWLGVAGASECASLSEPKQTLSVAWVSRSARQVGASKWLRVVANRDLAGLVRDEKAGVGRMLQALDLRRRESDPKRRFKVVVFEVDRGILCRPLVEQAEGTTVSGVSACPAPLSKQGPDCGYTTDRATDKQGLDSYRVRWRDAARSGFCVIPAARYVVQTR
jgi:hypothetical protein